MKKILFSLSIAHCISMNCAISQNFKTLQFKAFNGVQFEYGIHLPLDHQKDKSYELIAILCEVHENDKAWEDTMNKVNSIDLNRSIVIIPKIPIGNEHWGTHPIHHGFNDLLKEIRKMYGMPNQKMHLIGLGAGHETAFWWTFQSKLLASTSIINGQLWKEDRWDQKWYANLMSSGIPIYAYEEHVPSKFDMSKIHFYSLKSINEVLVDIESR